MNSTTRYLCIAVAITFATNTLTAMPTDRYSTALTKGKNAVDPHRGGKTTHKRKNPNLRILDEYSPVEKRKILRPAWVGKDDKSTKTEKALFFLPPNELYIREGMFRTTEFNELYQDGIDSLTISENVIVDQEGAQILAQALQDGRIKRLSFSGRTTDLIARNFIMEAIASSKEICSLSWGNDPNVTDLLGSITSALQHNTNLAYIGFSDITLTPDDAYELATALKENQTLQELSFIGVRGIGETEREMLRKANPKLNVSFLELPAPKPEQTPDLLGTSMFF